MYKIRLVYILMILAALLASGGTFFYAHAATENPTVTAPTASVWYFAEGRIGSGFKTFYTLYNPSSSACNVKIDYAYTVDGSGVNQTKTLGYTVQPNSRYTVNANADVPVSGPATLSATITNDNSTPTCAGIVAERPVQFSNFHGNSSGTDVIGSNTLQTTSYFADVPTHSAGESFLAVFNPNDTDAHLTASFYTGGVQVGTPETMTVAAHSRNTFQPGNDINLPPHVAAVITSDRGVVVERPSYFINEYGVSGAADIVGAPALAGDWTFAEGNTVNAQENLSIANLGNSAANVTITLKSLNGASQDTPVTIQPKSQLIWDVNAHNNFTGFTPEVSAIVHSDGSNLVVQREMYTNYIGSGGWSAQGISDTLGASSLKSTYSFSEGFTSVGYDESLALYNPTETVLEVTVTASNMLAHSDTVIYTVPANSRYTVNVNELVKNHLANAGEDARAYAISLTVSASSGFAVERSMHYHTPAPFEVQAANSVAGYGG